MSSRGSRFLGESALLFAAIDHTCSVCWPARKTVLLRHEITTSAGRFEDEHETFAGADAVEEQFLQDESGARFRYKLRCKRCHHQRVLKHETLSDALRAIYRPGARAKIVQNLI